MLFWDACCCLLLHGTVTDEEYCGGARVSVLAARRCRRAAGCGDTALALRERYRPIRRCLGLTRSRRGGCTSPPHWRTESTRKREGGLECRAAVGGVERRGGERVSLGPRNTPAAPVMAWMVSTGCLPCERQPTSGRRAKRRHPLSHRNNQREKRGCPPT